MAEDRHNPTLYWYDPEFRGIIPLEDFHCPKRLQRTIRAEPFEVTYDKAFKDVVLSCAAPARGRRSTWINDTIVSLYTDLYERDFAHSIECWKDGELVGGLYGVSLGKAFLAKACSPRSATPVRSPSPILLHA